MGNGSTTHLHRLPVWAPEGDSPQPVVNLLEQLATCVSLLGSSLLVHLDKLLVNRDGRAELDDCAGTELVRVEVGQADGDELDLQVRIGGHGAKSHDREAGLERQEVGPVMRTTCVYQLM